MPEMIMMMSLVGDTYERAMERAERANREVNIVSWHQDEDPDPNEA